MCWPEPVRSRWSSAPLIAANACTPVLASPNASMGKTGLWSGSPIRSMTPAYDAAMKS